MMIRDANLLRALFAARGLHKQIDVAKAIDMSQNSVVRLFKGKPVHSGTARRIAKFVERGVDELFVDAKTPPASATTE